MTRFATGERALPADALRVVGVDVQIVDGSAPTNRLSYPVVVAADAPPVRVFSAASGRGVYVLAPRIHLAIPADTYAARYSGAVTLTLAAGP